MSFKFCPECGYKLDREYKFCPECGYALAGTAEKKPEPLFDFSEDTAKYADEKFGGFDEQLKKAAAPQRSKRYKAITGENNLRLEEQSFVSDLQEAEKVRRKLDKDPKKRRSMEKELAERFNELFNEYVELGPENGITIQRDVPPEYFGAHPKCKPIHFLFKKNGKDVLAVAIVTANNQAHPAVRDVASKCRWKQGLNYRSFYVHMPNTEHYVIRTVLEAMGLIKRVY